MNYTLTRKSSTPLGTLGELTDDSGDYICYTCELPWIDNQPQISCIPTGIYSVVPHDSPAHPDVWELLNVPDRSGILIHNGNTEKDSKGCIVVGSEMGVIDGLPAVLNSNVTLEQLRDILPGNFTLTIY